MFFHCKYFYKANLGLGSPQSLKGSDLLQTTWDFRPFQGDCQEVPYSGGKVFVIEPFGNNIPNYIGSLDDIMLSNKSKRRLGYK